MTPSVVAIHTLCPDQTPPICLGEVLWSTFGGFILFEFHGTETRRYIATPQQTMALRDELNVLCAELVQAGLLPDTKGDDQT